MFNLVLDPVPRECPSCATATQRWVQYKYGALRMSRHQVGDHIHHDEFDEGAPGHDRVGVEGLGAPCPNCGHDDDLVYDIVIESDVISSVALTSGEIDYLEQGNAYWVLLPGSQRPT
ncbi:hypothetical protein [Actinokineospora sp. UTMC 2448]|uniref:hypothetical protein n=1 Tax=Actinokineospora sp. UTMC 2448 TaxID=2268449 RepID=UPI002164D086|nr:hypothetical protein [Actinokineospora sp. UTMC 2448]UVS77323.1 hypothetical protein Actkin_01031 [Actinokineospora sp. UTMC 2448]